MMLSVVNEYYNLKINIKKLPTGVYLMNTIKYY